jgi:hypothetical protein
MEAVRQKMYGNVNVMGSPVVDTIHIGKHYGLTDIREAQLIDSNWREQPMRAWDDVYESLCREVGYAYGLNDIREA